MESGGDQIVRHVLCSNVIRISTPWLLNTPEWEDLIVSCLEDHNEDTVREVHKEARWSVFTRRKKHDERDEEVLAVHVHPGYVGNHSWNPKGPSSLNRIEHL